MGAGSAVVPVEGDLQQLVLAIVELDLQRYQELLVEPDELAAVAAPLGSGAPLQLEAGPPLDGVVGHAGVDVLHRQRWSEILIGELASHERARLVSGADAPHPLRRGEVQPLIVLTRLVGMSQENGSSHVLRPVELDSGQISLGEIFPQLQREAALGSVALCVQKDQGERGTLAHEPLVHPLGFESDVLPGRVGIEELARGQPEGQGGRAQALEEPPSPEKHVEF